MAEDKFTCHLRENLKSHSNYFRWNGGVADIVMWGCLLQIRSMWWRALIAFLQSPRHPRSLWFLLHHSHSPRFSAERSLTANYTRHHAILILLHQTCSIYVLVEKWIRVCISYACCALIRIINFGFHIKYWYGQYFFYRICFIVCFIFVTFRELSR
jgi:hypothetical protein